MARHITVGGAESEHADASIYGPRALQAAGVILPLTDLGTTRAASTTFQIVSFRLPPQPLPRRVRDIGDGVLTGARLRVDERFCPHEKGSRKTRVSESSQGVYPARMRRGDQD
jgi:hypothetical protein